MNWITNCQFTNNISNFIFDHIYNSNKLLKYIQILIINQPFGNWTSRKIGPTPTNTPIPNAKANCGKKNTAKQELQYQKHRIEMFQLFETKLFHIKKQMKLHSPDANAQRKKKKKYRKEKRM